MPKYVYLFSEGNKEMRDLLGGKGANLAEMTNMGIPVPPGFVITTEACQWYMKTSRLPAKLNHQIGSAISRTEEASGKTFGDPENPLLLSVRSGAAASMPGMMNTVLNIGLNDETVRGLAELTGNERFAWDSYRRLLHMFGDTVLEVDDQHFEEAIDEAKARRGTTSDLDLTVDDLRELSNRYKNLIKEHTGKEFPQDPRRQLDMSVKAVFDSWNGERAILYRRQEQISNDLGTAVNIQAMVFGNLGGHSYTGVTFTRDPSTGENTPYGEWLSDAQGEDVVAGIRNAHPLAELAEAYPEGHNELLDVMRILEAHYTDVCDIEFTIERGKLWMLQTRIGKRTAAAAFIIAMQLVDEGIIDMDEALKRVTGAQLMNLMFPTFDVTADRTLASKAIAASPGAAVGKIVFDSDHAEELATRGEQVILVRRETTPEDLKGMVAAQGVLTTRGGKTSHAAVVARGMGRTCVCGAEDLDLDLGGKTLTMPDGTVLGEGDVISIDGTTGEVFIGEVPVSPSEVVQYFEGSLAKTATPLINAVHRIMTHADGIRHLAVRANADNPEDAARAARFGAQGIGLCRTEHMFLGERRQLVEDLILAEDDAGRQSALAELKTLQKHDYLQILDTMDRRPVIVRLLDPPLHEFLPDLTELEVKAALAEARGEPLSDQEESVREAVHRMHEQNPMLGLRGCRLGLVIPGLFEMQVRALCEATAELIGQGKDPQPEIMVPLVAIVTELDLLRARCQAVVDEVSAQTDTDLRPLIGTMIEVPRAALTAGEIASVAEFFSFGTNDLTQMTWGFSRDDVESAFVGRYIELGIFGVSPFESIDATGVGELVRLGTESGKAARSDLEVGVCGEHGGDPASVRFFHRAGVDYVSCSPYRVPVARLEAGRAAAGVA